MWGPLPTFGMFGFETFNRSLLGWVHGNQAVAMQMSKGFCRHLITRNLLGDANGNVASIALSFPNYGFTIPENCVGSDLVRGCRFFSFASAEVSCSRPQTSSFSELRISFSFSRLNSSVAPGAVFLAATLCSSCLQKKKKLNC